MRKQIEAIGGVITNPAHEVEAGSIEFQYGDSEYAITERSSTVASLSRRQPNGRYVEICKGAKPGILNKIWK